MLSVTQTRFINIFWLLRQTNCFSSSRKYLYEGLRSRGANLLHFGCSLTSSFSNFPFTPHRYAIILGTHYHNLSCSHKKGRQECIFQKIYLDSSDKGPDRDLTAVPDSALIWASQNQNVVAF